MSTKTLTVIQVLPALNGGGVEKGTLEIGKYLAQHGHRSIVVSAGGRMIEQLIREGSEHIQADIGAKKLSTLKYIIWFRKLLQEIRPDIIHLRSRLPAWVCYLAWKSLPKASRPHLVTTFHGQHSVNGYSSIMTCGERVITVSEFMRDHILESYPKVDPKKIMVIHRGVDTKIYNPNYKADNLWKENWYKTFPQTQNTAILTLPGRLTRRKGIEDFIEIIAALTKADLPVHGLIVGEPHPKQINYKKELEESVARLGLERQITFTGHRNDLQNIMSISSAVLCLSKKPEAFGRTVIEALSMGIPVIGYDHGGVKEQLTQLFPDGRVPLNDIQQACIIFQEKILDNALIVKNNTAFTLDTMCSKTLSVYLDLI